MVTGIQFKLKLKQRRSTKMKTLKKGSKGSEVRKWQSFLIEQDFKPGGVDGDFGPKTHKATIAFQKEHGLEPDGIVGKITIGFAKTQGFTEHVSTTSDEVTIEQLAHIMIGAKTATLGTHTPLINSCMKKYEINTALRKQHFLAQVGHESASLRYMHEIASGQAYEGRADLGNTQTGDGRKFRGHGPIQLTGRYNHTAFFEYLGRPELIETPEILETDLELAWLASGWFWMSKNLNTYADQDNVKRITKIINGGYNGLEDRKAYLARAKEVIID